MPRLDETDNVRYFLPLTGSVRERLNFELVGVVPERVLYTGGKPVAGKTILAVLGDRGGANAVLPPLRRALDAGCAVRLMLVGTSREQWQEGALSLDPRFHVEAATVADPDGIVTAAALGSEDLLVLGASQSEVGALTAARTAMQTGAPALAVQDLYGSSITTLDLLEREGTLDVISCLCVTDVYAKAHLVSRGFDLADRVVVTGGPQFDKVVEVKKTWAERRAIIRQGLAEDAFLVLIAGQLNGTAEILILLDAAAGKLRKDFRFVLRRHERASSLDSKLTTAVLDALGRHGCIAEKDVPREVASESEDVLPGVDLVLSGYSTTNFYGILHEMPGVVYCGTPALHWDLWREKGLLKPPEVEAGAAWYVETAGDLVHVLTELKKGDASDEVRRIKDVQRRIAQCNDGHATDRVWAEMEKLLA